jgi:dynein heavy chain
LEDVMLALGQLKVPKLWGSTYPSLKPLGSWMRDLALRIDFFCSWVDGTSLTFDI